MLGVIALIALIGVFWYLLSHGQTRVAVAFAVAPLAVPVVWFLTLRDPTAIVTALFAYPLVVLPGIPLYFLLRHFGWLDLWRVVVAGAILAACIGIALSRYASLDRGIVVLMCCASGAVVGLAFWLVAFAGAPSDSPLKHDPKYR